MDEITALCIVRDSLPGVLSVTQERAWQLVEEKFKTTNTGSPKLPDWKEVFAHIHTLRPNVEQSLSPCEFFARATYDYMVRQLRAGA